MRAIADGVDDAIEADAVGRGDVRRHRLFVDEAEREVARVVGIVGVRRLHQEPVDERLERTETDEAVARSGADAEAHDVAPERQGEERVDTDGELAAALDLAEEVEVGRAALDVGVENARTRELRQSRDVVDRRDSDAAQILEGEARAGQKMLEAHRWNE